MQDKPFSLYYLRKRENEQAKRLTNESKRHFDLVEKIHEQSLSTKMQSCIFHSLFQQTIYSSLTFTIQNKLHKKIGDLSAVRSEFQKKLSLALIQKQIGVDSENQRQITLGEYQARLQDLIDNLYQKELVICIDHVGKKWDEKPIQKRVKQFDKNLATLSIVLDILKKRTKISRSLGFKESNKIDSTLSESTKDEQNSKSLEEKDSQKDEKQNKIMRMNFDPTIKKIMLKIQKEQQIFNQLNQQYHLLYNKSKKLDQEHLNLVKRYRDLG